MNDVAAVIEQCKLKRLTLMYESKFTPLGKKHGAIVKLAKCYSIEVERAILYGELFRYRIEQRKFM